MRISDIIETLEADVIWAGDLDANIETACGSDMMSDVLAFVKNQAMLLTGLVNPQAVRTADMLDMRCITFVRGKKPGEEIIELAKERGITLLSTRQCMFTACGKLYTAGLGGSEN